MFWNYFQVTVEPNAQLSDIENFYYLKGRLTGEPKGAILRIFLNIIFLRYLNSLVACANIVVCMLFCLNKIAQTE